MASVEYDEISWQIIARTTSNIEGVLQSYGLTKDEATHLRAAVRAQYTKASGGESDLCDFVHLCVTAATILKKDGSIDWAAGIYAATFNGVFSIDAQSGYIGDAMGTNGVGPSMGPDDYKADLDAVNLAHRIEQSGKPLPSVMADYYADIETGNTNRAVEFIQNIGWETLEQQRESFITHKMIEYHSTHLGQLNAADPASLKQAQLDALAYAEQQGALYDTFLENLREANNELEE